MKVLLIIILIVTNGSLTLLHVFLCYSEMLMESGIYTRLVVTMPTMNVQCWRQTILEGHSSRAPPSMSTNLKWVRKDNLDNFPSFSSWLKFIKFHQIMRKWGWREGGRCVSGLVQDYQLLVLPGGGNQSCFSTLGLFSLTLDINRLLHVPYSGKLSRGPIFADFVDYCLTVKIKYGK